MRTVHINGVRLAYQDSVETSPPTAVPLMTLHGAPGMGDHSGDWRTFGALADRYRVVSFDQRGSGLSEDGGPYSHEQFCDDLDALRRTLGFDRIILAGGSYGGMLALEYAVRHPDRLHALVLRDTAASGRFQHLALERALASDFPMDEAGLARLFAGETTSDDDFRALIAMIMPLYTVTFDPLRDAQAVAAMHIHHQTHNYAFSRNQQAYDVTGALPGLRVPTLVTVGRHDWITPLPASEEIARLIPGSELVVFENSGHGPQNEERERWLSVVGDFLARNVPA